MNDAQLLYPIDSYLESLLPTGVRSQFAGRVQQYYDPQLRRPAIMRMTDEGKAARFTIDTVHADVQVAHRMIGGQPIKNPSQWGSRQQIAFDLQWSMMVATRRPDIMPQFLLAFSALPDLAVSEFNTETLTVLKREFLFVPDQKTAYDPMLQCFSIQYRMLNISQQVFQTLLSNSFSYEQ